MFCLVNKKKLYLRSVNFYDKLEPYISWTDKKSEALFLPDWNFLQHFIWIISRFYKYKLDVENYN